MKLPLFRPGARCSLDAAALRCRSAEWAEVLAGAARRSRTADGLVAEVPAYETVRERIAALVVAEGTCCPHLRFTVTELGDRLRIEVTAQAAH